MTKLSVAWLRSGSRSNDLMTKGREGERGCQLGMANVSLDCKKNLLQVDSVFHMSEENKEKNENKNQF